MSSRTGSVRTTRRRLQVVDRSPSDPPTSLSDALPRLATVLEEAADEAGWHQPPALVRVTAWPAQPIDDGFDLGIKPIDDGSSVVETLAGFDAPADWIALGVITEGNARHVDRVARDEPARRVRCVHIVDRSGASASVLRLQGEQATVLDHGQPEGRIDDVCRRALALPTAAPSHSSVALWATLWLDRVLSSLDELAAEQRPQWPAVATLHPAVAVVVDDDSEREREATEKLERLAEVLAEVQSWSVLRRACAAGDWPVGEVPPSIAEWLDDGAFSRWVLGAYPPVAALADAACANVAPSAARRIRAALRAWGLA